MLTKAISLADIKTIRCGVIPYTIYRDSMGIHRLLFLFARDKLTKELGDFGGGVKKDEFSLMAGMREFCEETHGVFSHIYTTPNDVTNKLAIIDFKRQTPSMAIIFVPLENKWITDAQEMFSQTNPTKTGMGEVCGSRNFSRQTTKPEIFTRPSKP